MSTNPPRAVPPGHEPDGLDRLLHDFYHNEMPHPWPALRPAAGPATVARDRTAPARRSRYTLAASVAGLLGLGMLLSSAGPGGSPNRGAGNPDVLKKADAKGEDLIENAKPMPGGLDPMSVPNMP